VLNDDALRLAAARTDTGVVLHGSGTVRLRLRGGVDETFISADLPRGETTVALVGVVSVQSTFLKGRVLSGRGGGALKLVELLPADRLVGLVLSCQ